MSDSIEIRIFDQDRLLFSEEFAEPVEQGQQRRPPRRRLYIKRQQQAGHFRVAIASLAEKTVSRKHVRIEPLAGRKARVTNQSAVIAFYLPDGSELKPGMTRDTMIPAFFSIGNKVVRVQPAEADEFQLQMLSEQTAAPGRSNVPGRVVLPPLPGAGGSGDGEEGETIVRWIQAFVDVQQSAAEPNALYRTAARSVVNLVGLDTGRALTYDQQDWKVLDEGDGGGSDAESEWAPSRKILSRLIKERRTFWQDPKESGAELGSLAGVNLVVAAPILNRRGEVIGALYGERRPGGRSAGMPKIRKLDALLVELLANGVAAGLRADVEEAGRRPSRRQVQFEQFFTPEQPDGNGTPRPDLLEGARP